MMYSYRGVDAQGTKVRSKIEAASLEEAKNRLRHQNILYEHVAEASETLWTRLAPQRRYRIKTSELAELSRELAMYLRSGITVVNAIRILQNQYKHHKKMHLFLKTVGTHLEEGKDFFSALNAQRVVQLPDFFKHSIKVSESGGMLDDVLLELSRFLSEQERISMEVQSAFAYPAFMLFISLITVTFMLTFVVPQITAVFADLNQELPLATRLVVTTGAFIEQHYGGMTAALLGAIVTVALLYRFSAPFAFAVDRTALLLPLFGTIIRKSEFGRFSYISALLVRSGVPLVQSIDLSGKILRNRVLQRAFASTAAKVVEGKRLSVSLAESPYPIDPAFVQALALAEETSQVESVLMHLSQLYFQQNRDKIALLLRLLEPLLMLFVGGVIGLIVAAMLLPIFSMSIG